MKTSRNRILSIALALFLVLGLASGFAPAEAAQPADPFAGFEGKTLSVLGDSISTYTDWSSGTAANTANTTLAGGAVYYTPGRQGVYVDDTWWKQTADILGMEILVNNSWSGSCIYQERYGTVGAYVDRCVQLHDNVGENAGEEPDIIAVYLGTNDFNSYSLANLGTAAAIDYGTLITKNGDSYAYAAPATAVEAYAIMLHKMMVRYPNAEIYCFTMLQFTSSNNRNNTSVGNAEYRGVAEHFGLPVVDLYNCGIAISGDCKTYMMGSDTLHPTPNGMDAITNCFLSALYKNSRYMDEETEVYDVTYELDGTFVLQGEIGAAVAGQPFTVSFPEQTNYVLDMTVTMGGENVTDLYVTDHTLSIPSVTGDITVTASSKYDKTPKNYLWGMSGGSFSSAATGDGVTANPLELTAGGITDGEFADANYSLGEEVWLSHDRPWSVEWRSTGAWVGTGSGALLFSGTAASGTAGNMYLYRRSNADFIALGYRDGSVYHNYGVLLSSKGIDFTAAHTYRLTNQVGESSNMVYLYVDGVLMGAMNEYVKNGTPQYTTSNWISGQDFLFRYMGTPQHPINDCSIEYLRVWENGGAPNGPAAVHTVTFELDNGITVQGAALAEAGKAYTATLSAGKGYLLGEVTVTMGGEDITDSCYADGVITIPSVTGDIVITAAMGQRTPLNYTWEMRPAGLFSVADWGSTVNLPTREDSTGSVSDGKLTGVIYSMERSVTLYHDRPWAIEWESSGTWNNGPKGNMLLSAAKTVSNAGEFYIYRRHNTDFLIAFGEKVGSAWNNYGIRVNSWFTQQGLDPAASHVYRLYNKVGQEGNMVWLSIDGIEVGPLNQVDVNGTGKGTTSNYLSGKDFVFSYMGTTSHPLDNCSIGYVKVWENGEPAADPTPAEYRFQLGADGLASSGGSYDSNRLTLITGSYSSGTFNNAAYELEEALHLAHDYPWVIEWKSSGSWHGQQQGAMLFAEYNASDFIDAYYFYRRASDAGNPNFFGFGNRSGSKWYNYGLTHQVDDGSHVFRLTNKVAEDGSNMVWLSVDGVEIGPMNGLNEGGYDKGTVDLWVSGKDFHFSFLGAGKHLINSCSIDYIHVQECGHSWEDGTCTACGKVCGHSWEDGTCTVCGKVCGHSWEDGTCTVCGKVCGHSWEDGTCTVCGKVCGHSWEDGTCTVCGKVCGHSRENGICTVCGEDSAAVTVENGQVTVSIPGAEEGSLLYAAFYTAEGQFLRCEAVTVAAGQEEFLFTLSEGETVAVYLMDDLWTPLRAALEP